MPTSFNPTIATIDPGIRGTGIAIWPMENWRTVTIPIATYVITPPSEESWVEASRNIWETLDPILTKHNVGKAYCEFPQYFASATGHAATAKGEIYKLAYLVGIFSGMMHERSTILEPVLVNVWKGQLSKDAVITRLLRREPKLADLGIKTHAWDAVGIGFYAKGMFGSLKK